MDHVRNALEIVKDTVGHTPVLVYNPTAFLVHEGVFDGNWKGVFKVENNESYIYEVFYSGESNCYTIYAYKVSYVALYDVEEIPNGAK